MGEAPTPQRSPLISLFIMSATFSREVMLGMLRQGNTGDQILGILDAIVSDVRDENVQEQQELVSAS